MILIISIIFAVSETHRYQNNYTHLQRGDSKEKVRQLLGSPDSITDGSKAEYGFERSPDEIPPQVFEEYWYYCKYGPEVWSVAFNKEEIVINTYHLISP